MGNPKRLCFMVSSIAWKMGNVKGYLKKNVNRTSSGHGHWKAEGGRRQVLGRPSDEKK